MTQYEYKIVPAPRKGRKGKGVKGPEARFAFAIEGVVNDYAAQGWEFQRAEVLPSEERHGLTSAQTVYRDLLIFRRPRTPAEDVVNPAPLEQDDDTAEESAPTEEHVWRDAQNDDAQTSAEDVLEDDDQLEDNQPPRS
ncbi:DUF4177 domain-containing protein [Aquicoccus sp. G2-2]|uniref:DUF4177 domain-containing protein n=1 Tax=Aquicoccus sp. G2-2 TaxID=3092120 RepID=UPI002ADF13D9|nr:DUF4177 domain-containing protein [Aquicoccus sp. G2-2]MEA1113566.1 DUF4177 domain-containing protein [Aquicoccus sp. G2-2]